ncbi:MAG: DUF1801 domain-containing protein [bacterium]|nr:DUF1801 domain-containing protein [bacterium]
MAHELDGDGDQQRRSSVACASKNKPADMHSRWASPSSSLSPSNMAHGYPDGDRVANHLWEGMCSPNVFLTSKGITAMQGKTDAATHEEYIAQVSDARRPDIQRLHDLVREVAPELEPTMEFGIMGYGKYAYKYASGRDGEWTRIGIANNKQYISFYCCVSDDVGYVAERYRERLPKANIGKSCVRFKRVSDLDENALRELIRESADIAGKKNATSGC